MFGQAPNQSVSSQQQGKSLNNRCLAVIVWTDKDRVFPKRNVRVLNAAQA
jgi:glyceraldehyde-3-phosphate dehydrogenase/erythrose-4-phosphate dehydrogenase